MSQLNVYRGNSRGGCYFQQESNDKRIEAKDDQDTLLPRLLKIVGGSEKSRFECLEWLRSAGLKFS